MCRGYAFAWFMLPFVFCKIPGGWASPRVGGWVALFCRGAWLGLGVSVNVGINTQGEGLGGWGV